MSRVKLADTSTPVRHFKRPPSLHGMAAVEGGFAVVTVSLNVDGTVAALHVGPAQAFPEFVGIELSRAVKASTNVVLGGR